MLYLFLPLAMILGGIPSVTAVTPNYVGKGREKSKIPKRGGGFCKWSVASVRETESSGIIHAEFATRTQLRQAEKVLREVDVQAQEFQD